MQMHMPSERPTLWTVGEVASLAHVSVRTLHYYDEIGLLVPSERSDAGYRLYAEGDLERLHQILLYRELGFALEAIRRMLDEPAIDRRAELEAQKAILVESKRRTEAVIRAVDRTLESMARGRQMTADEMFEGFEDLRNAPDDIRAHHAEHARETHERWGESDAYAQSMRRARKYSRSEWETIRKEGEKYEEHMAWLLEAGADPEGEDGQGAAEAMRQHINRGSTRVRPGCMPAWPTCTSRTRGSPPIMTSERMVWPPSLPVRSGRMPVVDGRVRPRDRRAARSKSGRAARSPGPLPWRLPSETPPARPG